MDDEICFMISRMSLWISFSVRGFGGAAAGAGGAAAPPPLPIRELETDQQKSCTSRGILQDKNAHCCCCRALFGLDVELPSLDRLARVLGHDGEDKPRDGSRH